MNRLAANTQDIRRHTLENSHGLINLNAKFDLSNGSLQDLHTLVRSSSSSAAAELSQLKENQDWMATVQDFLPEEVQDAIFNRITAAVENASQRRCGSNRRVRHQKIVTPSAQPHEEETALAALGPSMLTRIPASKDLVYQSKNVNPPPVVRMHKPPRYQKRVYTWNSTTLLGRINVEVDESSNDPWYEQGSINVKIKIGPSCWLATRAVQLHLAYDKTHGLSSPSNIRLVFPRVRPWTYDIEESIAKMGHDSLEFEKFVNLFRERGYHPNDLYRNKWGDDKSLLNVSQNVFVTRVKILASIFEIANEVHIHR